MQAVSDLWRTIAAGRHCKEVKAVIGGEEYPMSSIVLLTTHSGLFGGDSPAIGGCVAGEIEISFFPAQTPPPPMAEIRLYVRVASDSAASEWLPKGVFFADTRSTDEETGVCTINGFDAMLKTEQSFLSEVTEDDWPQPAPAVAAEIAARIGVSLDSRTVLDDTCMVAYPLDYTCREVLGQIAVAHGGNWIISDRGELRLVGLAEIPEETNYLIDERGDAICLGEVRLIVG